MTNAFHDYYPRGYAPKAITWNEVRQCNIWLIHRNGRYYLRMRFPDGYIEEDDIPEDTDWEALYNELETYDRFTHVKWSTVPNLAKFLRVLRLARRPRLITFTLARLWKWEIEYGVIFCMFIRFITNEKKGVEY